MPPETLIAVLDDDLSVRRALGRLLVASGFRAGLFARAEELLGSRDREIADFAILDVHLPGMDGFEVCDRLRARRPGLPVIFVTAHDGVEDLVRARSYPGAAYLRKPFAAEELLGLVRSGLAGRLGAAPGAGPG